MKGNTHTHHGYEWNYNNSDHGRPTKRGRKSTNKRARVSAALRDLPSEWEPRPVYNWVGSHNGKPVYAWVG